MMGHVQRWDAEGREEVVLAREGPGGMGDTSEMRGWSYGSDEVVQLSRAT